MTLHRINVFSLFFLQFFVTSSRINLNIFDNIAKRDLALSTHGKIFAGVCGGLTAHLDVDLHCNKIINFIYLSNTTHIMEPKKLKKDKKYHELIKAGHPIHAIKAYQEDHGCSPQEAKEYIDKLIAIHYTNTPDSDDKYINLIKQGDKLEAVSEYKNDHNCGLKEAKDYIDQLDESLHRSNIPASEEKYMAMIEEGQILGAVSEYKNDHNCSLKEAKDYIDQLKAKRDREVFGIEDEDSTPADTAYRNYDSASENELKLATENKMIAGVCGGLAAYFGIDATIIRVILVCCVIFGGIGILLYLIAWLIMSMAK